MFSEDGSVLVHEDSIVVASRYNAAQMTFSGVVHIKKQKKIIKQFFHTYFI